MRGHSPRPCVDLSSPTRDQGLPAAGLEGGEEVGPGYKDAEVLVPPVSGVAPPCLDGRHPSPFPGADMALRAGLSHRQKGIGLAPGKGIEEACHAKVGKNVGIVDKQRLVPGKGLDVLETTAGLKAFGLVDEQTLATALRHLLADKDALAALAWRAWRITDGLGARRVAETILPNPTDTLRLRPARSLDTALYFEWANDPKTRQHAHNPEPTSWATHDRWFDARLADPESILWVMETPTGLPVGQTRVEVHEGTGILDYSVDPAFRGRSWGRRLLELTAVAWREQGREEPLEGTVLPHNAPSRSSSDLRINSSSEFSAA